MTETGPPPEVSSMVLPGTEDSGRATGRLRTVRRRLEWLLRRVSVPMLRVSLGVVFIWFGALKVAGVTPVAELVAGTLPWADPRWLVPMLGAFEIALGLAMIAGFALLWVSAAMVAHLCGTFLTAVTQPATMFQHGNPLMLTMEGEFVAKNLVLITAGLVVAVWSNVRAPAGTGHRSGGRPGR